VPDAELDLDYVAEGPRAMASNGSPRVALSNSFGFGGHNVVLVFAAAASGQHRAGAGECAARERADGRAPLERAGEEPLAPGVFPF
jgi:hypothetical protein